MRPSVYDLLLKQKKQNNRIRGTDAYDGEYQIAVLLGKTVPKDYSPEAVHLNHKQFLEKLGITEGQYQNIFSLYEECGIGYKGPKIQSCETALVNVLAYCKQEGI